MLLVGSAGSKAIADVIAEDIGEKPRKPSKKRKGETTETVEPATIKDKAEDVAKEILKISGDSRKMSLSLQGIEYSGSLAKDLATFSKDWEKMFTDVQKRLRKKKLKKKDKTAFAEFVNDSENKIEWWKKAEAPRIPVQEFSQPFPKTPLEQR